MAKAFHRIDLVPKGQLSTWLKDYPVGRKITLPDLEGTPTSYLVQKVDVQDTVFHPETNACLVHVNLTLLPS